MRIFKLVAQGFKNLKAIEITPEGNVIKLNGENGAGKSAILDAILCTLTGKKVLTPIRDGEDRAEVSIDMGEFTVRTVWTPKGERLEVVTKDGDVKKSPRSFIEQYIGKLSFDPLEFKSMKSKDQIDLLKELLALDFSDIDADKKKAYDDRTILNSKIVDAVAQLKNAIAPALDVPEEELSFKEELDKLNQLREQRDNFVKATQTKNTIIEHGNKLQEAMADKMNKIKALESEVASLSNAFAANNVAIEEFILPSEVTSDQIMELELSLQHIEDKNVKIKEAKRYNHLIKESNKLKLEADKHTQRLERLDQDKATRIANAKFPVEGLSFNESGVIFNDQLFSELSTGQQIRVSTAIAMKLNPTLRAIFIRQGSLIDKAGLKEMADIAKENDYILWMECNEEAIEDVTTGKMVYPAQGYYIEDGAITHLNGLEVEQPVIESSARKSKSEKVGNAHGDATVKNGVAETGAGGDAKQVEEAYEE